MSAISDKMFVDEESINNFIKSLSMLFGDFSEDVHKAIFDACVTATYSHKKLFAKILAKILNKDLNEIMEVLPEPTAVKPESKKSKAKPELVPITGNADGPFAAIAIFKSDKHSMYHAFARHDGEPVNLEEFNRLRAFEGCTPHGNTKIPYVTIQWYTNVKQYLNALQLFKSLGFKPSDKDLTIPPEKQSKKSPKDQSKDPDQGSAEA